MNQAKSVYVPSLQDTVRGEISGDQVEFERILRLVAHGFEDSAERNVPRLKPYVNYFRNCNNVLDIGCGEGLMLELLHEAGVRAVGIDIDADKVTAVCSKGLEAINIQPNEYLRDKKGEFDGIFLRHLIEHFDGPEGVHLLYLCRKALRPNGVIVVVTPNYKSSDVAMQQFWLDVTHRRPYPLPLLLHIFATLGIAVVRCEVREMGLDLVVVGQVPE